MVARKIVVLDDSETVLEMTREVLEGAGYAVVTASSPALFPTTISHEKPDLVLVDVSMPVMGGRSVVELVRRNRLTHCPLVLFSDRPEKELAEIAQACGADGFIRKTADAARLLEAVAARLSAAAPVAVAQSNEVVLVTAQPIVRAALTQALQASGCVPTPVDDVRGLVEQLVRSRPLAVLLDLDSGGMPGDGCCRAIKEHPRLRSLPVLLMTGNTSSMQVMRICRAGADDVLDLPVEPDQLRAKIAAVRATTATASELATPPSAGADRPLCYSKVQFRAPGMRTWQSGLAYATSVTQMFVRTLNPEGKSSQLELRTDLAGHTVQLAGTVAWRQALSSQSDRCPAGMSLRLAAVPDELARHWGRALKPLTPSLPPLGPTPRAAFAHKEKP